MFHRIKKYYDAGLWVAVPIGGRNVSTAMTAVAASQVLLSP